MHVLAASLRVGVYTMSGKEPLICYHGEPANATMSERVAFNKTN